MKPGAFILQAEAAPLSAREWPTAAERVARTYVGDQCYELHVDRRAGVIALVSADGARAIDALQILTAFAQAQRAQYLEDLTEALPPSLRSIARAAPRRKLRRVS